MFELFNSTVCTIQSCVFAQYQSVCLDCSVCPHYSVLCVCTIRSVCLHYSMCPHYSGYVFAQLSLCICAIQSFVFALLIYMFLDYSVRCVCTMLYGKCVTYRQHYGQAVYLPCFRSSDPREKEGQRKEDNEMCHIARHEQPTPSVHN